METLTAIVFSLGVALGFLFLPLKKAETALIGDITKINLYDLAIAIIISSAIFIIIEKIHQKIILADISEEIAKVEGVNLKKCNFLYLLSIALVVSMEIKIVGALLPVALSAIPASTAKNFSQNLKQYTFGSLIIGIIAFLVSFLIFKLLFLPLGPIIIIVDSILFVLSVPFSKKVIP